MSMHRRLPIGPLLAGFFLVAGPAPAEPVPPVELSLQSALERALESDETLLQAAETVRAAQAGVGEARSYRLPHLDLTGQYNRNLKKPSFFLPAEFGALSGGATKVEMGEDNDVAVQATLSWTLWTAGRLSAASGAAREMLEASGCQEQAVRDLVRFGVREAYYRCLLSEESLRIARKAFEETEEAARVARAGHENGTVSRFDLLRAEVELANRRPPLVAAENRFDQNLLLLRRRCGMDPSTPITLTDGFSPVAPRYDRGALVLQMYASSPELRVLEHQIAAQKQVLRGERAERGPLLQATGSYLIQGQWSEDFAPDDQQLAKSSAVGLGMSWPIFDGRKAKARIDAARADLRRMEHERDRVSRDRELAVRQAHLALENARAALEGQREAVRLAEEAHRLAVVRLREGLATPLERLDAELAMSTARGQLAEALYSLHLADANLELAVGAPPRPDESIEGGTSDE